MSWLRVLPSGHIQAVYRDRDGRQRSRSFGTKRDAREFLAEVDAQLRGGRWVDPQAARTTLADLETRWWAARVVEPTTAAAARSRLDRHVLAEFGDRRVGAIRHLEVAGWVAGMSRSLAPETVRSCYRLLAAILDAAVREELIAANPCTGVALPPIRRRDDRPELPTRAQVDALADAMPDRYRVAVLLAAYAGLRWGEIVGLRAGRIDMLRRELHVLEVGEEVSGRVTCRGYPKSEAGRRVVPLPDVLLDGLARHLAAYPALSAELVIRTATGTTPLRGNRRRYWLRACSEIGISPPPRFHDLRGWYGTALADAGVPPHVLQAVLGHGHPATSIRLYTRVRAEARGSVRSVFGQRADGMPMAGT